ncbi:MAG: glycosyltransferase [Verrucomicrobia bacterium]|jgi:hypothetical protein|nr:glycosyltransferase [Verrucomicrobiota bacterium]
MNLEWLAIAGLTLAAVPAGLFLWNFFLVRPPRSASRPALREGPSAVSVLIPARNEAANIGPALDSILANHGVEFEVVVLDDGSTDGTSEIVKSYARRDGRVRCEAAPPLPDGWCGKPHACHVLAGHARHGWLVFLDADVRLAPDALPRMVAFMQRSGAALASGVPRQITGTFSERLLIPLVHFVLLGFLPVWRMRRCTKPAYAAGCGQLFIAEARTYHATGGHARIRSTLHDGIRLPRLFRQNGFRTDLFDATDVASCRMYAGAREVVKGLMKNAHEALASRVMIAPMSAFLLGGQVLPWALLAAWTTLSSEARWMSVAGAGLGLLPRLWAAIRFRQSLLGAVLHPFSVLLFVFIQWVAFARTVRGKPTQWRGRAYAVRAGAPAPTHSAGPAMAHPKGRWMMRRTTMFCVAALVLGSGLARIHGGDAGRKPPGEASDSADATPCQLKEIQLEDQFGATHRFTFPASAPMVLLAADKKGYERLTPWIEAARERWSARASVVGVADMRGVPGVLRGMVRGKFRSAESYPVLLDWNGAVLGCLRPEKGVPNVYLIDAQGLVVLHASGEASDSELKRLEAGGCILTLSSNAIPAGARH